MQTSGCSAVCCAVGARHGLVYLAQYAMLRECDTGNGYSQVDAVMCIAIGMRCG